MGERGLGTGFLVGYVVTIGAGTSLMKVALKDLSAYQVNLLMAVGSILSFPHLRREGPVRGAGAEGRVVG